MPWPPAVASRRIALVVYGLVLLLYLTLSGVFFALGFDARGTVIAAQLTGILGVSIWITKMMRIPVREAFSLRPAAPVHWRMAIITAVPAQIAGGALQFAIIRGLPEDSLWRQLMQESMRQFASVESLLELAMLFIAAVVVAAICEEALFRGLLLGLLRRRSGWVVAIVSSALLFGVFHLNPIVLLPTALIGAYLAILVWRSGSLYPAVLAHGLNNGLALFGLPYLVDEATYERYVGLVLAASASLFVLLVVFYLKGTTPAWRPDILESLEIDGRLSDGEQPEQAEKTEQQGGHEGGV